MAIKEKNVTGASMRMDFFLPNLFAILAASTAPRTAPPNGETAHQDPSDGIVGISEEFESKYGRYGEVQPILAPIASKLEAAVTKAYIIYLIKIYNVYDFLLFLIIISKATINSWVTTKETIVRFL